jgi:hypothetical protein
MILFDSDHLTVLVERVPGLRYENWLDDPPA